MTEQPLPPSSPAELMALLRRIRRQREVALKEVAAKIGISIQAVQQFETGHSRPTMANLRRWLRALDLPLEWAEEWQVWEIARRAAADVLARTKDEDAARAVEMVVRGVLHEHRRR